MKKTLKQSFLIILCCIFLFLLLFQSSKCIQLASNGLLIWYKNMIPSLFPFMVLSGFLIRSKLSIKIGQLLTPLLGICFRLSPSMLYAIFMGFLCGFPMGAKMVSDMLEKKQITLKEGEYLLAFCNNIGPLYMLGYVIPLFKYKNPLIILGWMYLVPLGYGLFLSYTSVSKNYIHKELMVCSYADDNTNYFICFQQSLLAAIEQITMLGGCMVFFNCILIIPELVYIFLMQSSFSSYAPILSAILSSIIEIGGGLQQLAVHASDIEFISDSFFLPLSLLTFGGFSCIIQTCFVLKNTGLKIRTYIKHKLIQSCIYILFMIAC